MSAVERALAALRRVERQERAVLRQGVQERQQRREGVLERLVQRQHLPGDLGPDGAGVVALLDVAVALEQVDDGEVGRGLAVGHRGALQHPPALRAVGVDTLIDQAGLAHPRFPHQGDHLAMAGLRLLPGPGAAPPAPCCRPTKGVSPRAAAACKRRRSALAPDQLEHLDGLRQPLHRHRPQGGDLHQALHQPQGGGGQADAARGGQLFHARRQMRGLPDGRVVHVQVVANGPHHHFPGVEAHAHAQLQAAGAAHLLGIARIAACMARAA